MSLDIDGFEEGKTVPTNYAKISFKDFPRNIVRASKLCNVQFGQIDFLGLNSAQPLTLFFQRKHKFKRNKHKYTSLKKIVANFQKFFKGGWKSIWGIS